MTQGLAYASVQKVDCVFFSNQIKTIFMPIKIYIYKYSSVKLKTILTCILYAFFVFSPVPNPICAI